jgi:2-isopropylmalate synthase
MRRNTQSYQHIDPALVGNEMRTVISELSGRANLFSKADALELTLVNEDVVAEVLREIKELEANGFSFEAAEASVALMLHRKQGQYLPPFELVDFSARVERQQGRGVIAEATVRIAVGDEVYHTAGDGNGPVNALNIALRKALIPVYPRLNNLHLADYKVRILNGQSGTASTTRVLIDMHSGQHRWSTVGASPNIIEASCQALTDGLEYGLIFA